jgi:hypothetical protein
MPNLSMLNSQVARTRPTIELGRNKATSIVHLTGSTFLVSGHELGERRLDVVEVVVVLSGLGLSFDRFWPGIQVKRSEGL